MTDTGVVALERWLEDRQVTEGWQAPDQFLAHEDNARIHTWEQEQAVEALIEELGWIDKVIVSHRSQKVLDGHLRVKIALRRDWEQIPYRVIDVDAREEALILAYFDSSTGMAGYDADILQVLDKQIGTIDKRLEPLKQKLWDGYINGAMAPDDFAEYGEDIDTEHQCPKCGYRWSGGIN